MKKILCFLVLLGGILFFNTSVNAYTIPSTTIDEQFIYDAFSSSSDFDISKTPYIFCTNSSGGNFACYAVDERFLELLYLGSTSSTSISLGTNSGTANRFYFLTTTTSPTRLTSTINGGNNISISSTSGALSLRKTYYSSKNYGIYSNFDVKTKIPAASSVDDKVVFNVFDFSKYTVNLEFNENLFANDPNFKKVCVNKNSSFSITKKTTDGVMSESDHDFIWFPYGISGIKQFNYSTEMSNGYYEFVNPYENFYFSSYDSINSIWNTEYMADNFESKGYTDKYKYYGYTAYLFLHWYNFNDGQTYNFFPIFEVTDNVTTSHISSSGNNHGGGGTRLDGDEEIELSDQYCFYIKNDYEVNEVILDEWGDHYTSVNTPNGPTNYGTTVNKDNANSKSFLLQPLEFISQMSGTIAFINTHIYNFYMAMPLIVRTFIVTALVIFIVILIMKIGGYQ